MMMHNITPSVDFNERLQRLDTQLNEPTNQNSIKTAQCPLPFGMTCKIMKE